MSEIAERRGPRGWRWLGAAVLLGGCAAGQVSTGNQTSLYSASEVSAAAAGGLPLVVRGNPFALPEPEAEAAVARAMQLPGWFSGPGFLPVAPEAAAQSTHRVVLAFSEGAPYSARRLCEAAESVPEEAPQGGYHVRAAFCVGDRVASEVFGRSAARDAGAPAFRDMMYQLSYALFPPRNPDREREGLPFGPFRAE